MPNRIREFRVQRGLTQEALAKALKVNKFTIWRWENEYTGISQDYVIAIARFFQVAPVELFPDYRVVPSPEEPAIV